MYQPKPEDPDSRNGGDGAVIIDFSQILFIGITKLGLTEKAVSHMSYYKWRLLFEQYKKFFNIEKNSKYVLKEENDKDILRENNSWF